MKTFSRVGRKQRRVHQNNKKVGESAFFFFKITCSQQQDILSINQSKVFTTPHAGKGEATSRDHATVNKAYVVGCKVP